MSLRAHLASATTDYLTSLLKEHRGDIPSVCKAARVSQATLYRRLPKLKARTRALLKSDDPKVPVKVTGLLSFFGVEVGSSKDARFWEAHRGQLDVLYFDARKGYMAMVRRLHPDTGGSQADAERLAQVNAAWARLEDAFRKHGWQG